MKDSASIYSRHFYEKRRNVSEVSAQTILSILFTLLPKPRAAVDVGCGTGTWTRVLKEYYGVTEVVGIDGPWVDEALLEIDRDLFVPVDLYTPHGLCEQFAARSFDLAVCLEVAEHLPESSAGSLVEALTHLSPCVLFSAAIPKQGGVHHVNEQWPSYWAGRFAGAGFVTLDVIRPRVWNDGRVALCYRQNVMLFVDKVMANAMVNCECPWCGVNPLPLVHPELYLMHRGAPSVRRALRLLVKAIVRHFRRRVLGRSVG